MELKTPRTTIRFLLAEDNEDHALLTELALKDAQDGLVDDVQVDVVADGEEALRWLRREGEHGGAPRPDLVLLDINMPGMSGLETLKAIKADPALAMTPVIVLTTSAAERDIVASYHLGANEYVTKPVTVAEFRSKLQAIPTYWTNVVARLPNSTE